MPEITDAEYRQFVRYQGAGSPEEVEKAVRKVPELEGDNKKYRDRLKEVEAAQPGEGAVVLTGDDAKRWEAVKAMGKTPEEITAELEKGTQAAAELAKREKRDNARKAAEAAGLNPDAYMALPGALDGTHEVRTETVDGKPVTRAYVKDAEGKEHPLSADYVKGREDWKYLAAAVEAKPAEQQSRPWLEQKQGDAGSGGYDPVAEGKKMAEAAKATATDASLAFK